MDELTFTGRITWPSYTIAGFEIREAYGEYDEPHVAIHRADGPCAGEGGDFPIAKLREVLEAFYEAHF